MDRIRSNAMPSPPKCIEEIENKFKHEEVKRLYGSTSHKENVHKNTFYRTTYVCPTFGYSVFASQRIIDLIKTYDVSDRKYLMDGTFKVVPKMFKQLLIIHFETPSKYVCFIISFN